MLKISMNSILMKTISVDVSGCGLVEGVGADRPRADARGLSYDLESELQLP